VCSSDLNEAGNHPRVDGLEAVEHDGQLYLGKGAHHPAPEHLDVRMAAADLALGATGVSSWERCCLGLPTVAVIVADNQRENAVALAAAGAIDLVGEAGATEMGVLTGALADALKSIVRDTKRRRIMAERAAMLCDGLGLSRVVGEIAALLGSQTGLARGHQ